MRAQLPYHHQYKVQLMPSLTLSKHQHRHDYRELKALCQFLKSNGFTSNYSDACVYKKHTDTNNIYLLFWVDDIIVASSDMKQVNTVNEMLNTAFKMDDRGQVKWILGIDFQRQPDGSYCMSQKRYVNATLSKFNKTECNPAAMPANTNTGLLTASADKQENNQDTQFPYRQAVGCFIYPITGTRPDISWTVSKLSQFFDKPNATHVQVTKPLLHYLKGTKHYTLKFSTKSKEELTMFTDSDWAGDTKDRRSTSGYLASVASSHKWLPVRITNNSRHIIPMIYSPHMGLYIIDYTDIFA
ncbi:uncharacterized protein [Watersipora subatra]|uniref:uncharacterized protein n=1 Tax=Watersipora subatra TaxID=2589382 RepID=UPI00355B88EE